jgi:hypothetical protein
MHHEYVHSVPFKEGAWKAGFKSLGDALDSAFAMAKENNCLVELYHTFSEMNEGNFFCGSLLYHMQPNGYVKIVDGDCDG